LIEINTGSFFATAYSHDSWPGSHGSRHARPTKPGG
jgi:hypothetical protein